MGAQEWQIFTLCVVPEKEIIFVVILNFEWKIVILMHIAEESNSVMEICSYDHSNWME